METLTKAGARTYLFNLALEIAAQLFDWATQTGNTALQAAAIATEPSTYHHSAGQ